MQKYHHAEPPHQELEPISVKLGVLIRLSDENGGGTRTHNLLRALVKRVIGGPLESTLSCAELSQHGRD